jgi:hypothetical protein
MNPWGFILVALGIVLIMIGITGSQHKILQIFKGIPSAARGKTVAAPAPQNNKTTAETGNSGTTVV